MEIRDAEHPEKSFSTVTPISPVTPGRNRSFSAQTQAVMLSSAAACA